MRYLCIITVVSGDTKDLCNFKPEKRKSQHQEGKLGKNSHRELRKIFATGSCLDRENMLLQWGDTGYINHTTHGRPPAHKELVKIK